VTFEYTPEQQTLISATEVTALGMMGTFRPDPALAERYKNLFASMLLPHMRVERFSAWVGFSQGNTSEFSQSFSYLVHIRLPDSTERRTYERVHIFTHRTFSQRSILSTIAELAWGLNVWTTKFPVEELRRCTRPLEEAPA